MTQWEKKPKDIVLSIYLERKIKTHWTVGLGSVKHFDEWFICVLAATQHLKVFSILRRRALWYLCSTKTLILFKFYPIMWSNNICNRDVTDASLVKWILNLLCLPCESAATFHSEVVTTEVTCNLCCVSCLVSEKWKTSPEETFTSC